MSGLCQLTLAQAVGLFHCYVDLWGQAGAGAAGHYEVGGSQSWHEPGAGV